MTNVNVADADPRDRSKSKRVFALKELWPFLKPYKLMILAAFIVLTLTAVVSLILPLAVRRVVDTFSLGNTIILDQYFVAAIGIAGLLSIGTALRYALVTRLGERVVTDIRKAVFARVIHLSPQFFEKIMTGEVLSRITTDTTVILSVIGSSISIALRNVFIFNWWHDFNAVDVLKVNQPSFSYCSSYTSSNPCSWSKVESYKSRKSGLDCSKFR